MKFTKKEKPMWMAEPPVIHDERFVVIVFEDGSWSICEAKITSKGHARASFALDAGERFVDLFDAMRGRMGNKKAQARRLRKLEQE